MEDVIVIQLTPQEASELELLLRQEERKFDVSKHLINVLEKVTDKLQYWEEN